MRFAWRVMVVLALMPAVLGGCRRSSIAAGAAGTATASGVKVFPIRGKIVSVDTAKATILLDHEAVPGFMDAMTMSYKLKQPGIVSELHPGDRITAKLLVRQMADGFEDAILDEIVVTAQAKPDYKPTVDYHTPTAGDAVPDFKLVNEDGRTIHLAQFKGQIVLLTFIYTRCPLEDYCPRMNKNFAQIDKALVGDLKLYRATHLLSISFDPKYDSPSVMKEYGRIYAGAVEKTFAHWEFAAPPKDEVGAITQFFDVGITQGDDGTLTHSMSTALIGKDGKVLAWYPTNEWTPEEVLAAMKSAAAS